MGSPAVSVVHRSVFRPDCVQAVADHQPAIVSEQHEKRWVLLLPEEVNIKYTGGGLVFGLCLVLFFTFSAHSHYCFSVYDVPNSITLYQQCRWSCICSKRRYLDLICDKLKLVGVHKL